MNIKDLFECDLSFSDNFAELPLDIKTDQNDTANAFSNKWSKYDRDESNDKELLFDKQKQWYLKLFGFQTENSLAEFIKPIGWQIYPQTHRCWPSIYLMLQK